MNRRRQAVRLVCAMVAILTVPIGLATTGYADTTSDPSGSRAAVFAGGCFWCVESDFDRVHGVLSTTSGYTGGTTENPTYESINAGGTGHKEAVRIVYDPKVVTYAALLDVFWHSVDPTDDGGQFCDRGESYETAIFVADDEERRLAEASKNALTQSGKLKEPIITPIVDAGIFYAAEDYHQDYYTKNAVRYKLYRYSCGRNQRVQEIWGEDAYKGIVMDH